MIRTYLNLREALEIETEKDVKELLKITDIKPDIDPSIKDLELSDEDKELSDFVINP